MDGRRIVAFFDECRFYLEPLKRLIEDVTLTGRKQNMAAFLVAQQAEHFCDSPLGLSLVQQMRTKFIFPDASHDPETLIDRMKISPAAVRMLKGEMTLGKARRFLLWRPHAPAICEFDLSGVEQLPILSGRAGTLRLMDKIKSENSGMDAPHVLEEFFRRLQQTRNAA